MRKSHLESQLGEHLVKQANDTTDKGHDDRTESLRKAVEKLPVDQQALLVLRYRECFEISQISDIVGVPEGTVKSRLHRTVQKLRQIMGQQ